MSENNIYEHGLVVMRAQPLHIGHERVIKDMLGRCAKVTVILGSIQEQGTERNPFSYTERKQMIHTVFAEETTQKKLKVIGLFDIKNPTEWGNFVIDFMQESFPDLARPDVYFAGSDCDAQWFKGVFGQIEIINRLDYDFPYVSGSMVRDMITIGDLRWKNFINPQLHKTIEAYKTNQKGII